ncbi:MAG: ubiquinol-cytochrome C chaperone family protein [Alphaproteobacteria bacterium]|nr:ubiquinol-cytochrome C chaperone family protein [Alphaproteobacteria bacterium]
MISLFRRNSTDTTAAARALYATIVDQSRQPGFFTLWGIPDTPNGRFEVLVLHVFLVMHRMRDDADCAKLARSLSEQAGPSRSRSTALRKQCGSSTDKARAVKKRAEGIKHLASL